MTFFDFDPEYIYFIAKKHLRLDFNDDFHYLIFLSEVALEYVRDAVDIDTLKNENNTSRLLLLILVIITDMYEHRSMSFESSANSKVQYTVRSIINQLQAGDDDE
jgi:uncharacterized phage protein (predicted DNA packaging)